MTQEYKELLLKDLCARMPYGVKVHAKYIDTDTNVEDEKDGVLSMVDNDTVIAFTSDDSNCYNYVAIHEVKPYLFPLSSMTEEQLLELTSISFENSIDSSIKTLDWCYRRHIDINNLIPMGLAIDTSGLNIY